MKYAHHNDDGIGRYLNYSYNTTKTTKKIL